MKPISITHAHRNQSGFTLIEILVAVLIFSFGLLGLIGLQSRAMQFTGNADERNRAASLAADAAAQMYTLRSAGLTGTAYADWQAKVQDPSGVGLPGGAGTISVPAMIPGTATQAVDITITWQSPNSPLSTYKTQVLGMGPATPPAVP